MALPRPLRRVVAVTGAATIAATLTVGATAAPAGAASKDAQLAEEGVIVEDDLTGSWSSQPDDSSSDKEIEKRAKKVSACKTYLKARKTLDGATNAASDTFLAGDEDLQNEVWVFKKASQAEKAFDLMADPANADCLTDVFQAVFADLIGSDPSVTGVRAAVAQSTSLPAIGDDIVGYAGGAEATLRNGSTERLPLANLVVLVGRAVVSYSFTGGPTATGEYTQALLDNVDAAVDATVTRLEDAQ